MEKLELVRPDYNYSSRINRRHFLSAAGAAFVGLAVSNPCSASIIASPSFSANPFTLGVASGDPLPDGIVLWTRLAPDLLNGGGMSQQSVQVRWQVAADEQMRRVIRRGVATASPEYAHSVHVDVRGLEPGRWYWYQFKVGAELSPVGRTRTAPADGTRLDHLAFAFVSCQNWQDGYFTAYQHLTAEDLDLVVHLGDYIYEGGIAPAAIRPHNSAEIYSLTDYRNRHALYKTDPHLQAAHACFPWLMTWDDHEVDNNYAGDLPENPGEREFFLARRAAAYQAYYEHMPLRRSALPIGPDMLLYRRLTFGDLVQFSALDTRQYRTDQPCGDGRRPRCAKALDPAATLTGPRQEKWLLRGLAESQARWNIIAQQVFMAQRDFTAGPGSTFSMDAWDGYVAARNRMLNFLQQRRPSNPVVLTGDVHSNWVADLKVDFDDPNSATVGTELVGTSVSSGGNGSDMTQSAQVVMTESPHVKFFNGQRGYVRCHVAPERWQADYRVVPIVTVPDGPITTRASFVIEDGRPGAQRL